MKPLPKKDYKVCPNCTHSELKYIKEREDFATWCKRIGNGHIVMAKGFCEHWKDKRNIAATPECYHGTKFPHCPNCGEELDIKYSGDDFRKRILCPRQLLPLLRTKVGLERI